VHDENQKGIQERQIRSLANRRPFRIPAQFFYRIISGLEWEQPGQDEGFGGTLRRIGRLDPNAF
jgi:hypothetical protein